MYKLDLHTHSDLSRDGGLSLDQYRRVLKEGKLDYIAITDHNDIAFALHAQGVLGEQIIVGEEIMTKEGEIIGLFLKERIEPGQSLKKTAKAIKAQQGLVYIPHPFETFRKGVSQKGLDSISDYVDIVEAYNGRTMQSGKQSQAEIWARHYKKAVASSSDAHGRRGWTKTYSGVEEIPTQSNLVELLRFSTHKKRGVGLAGRLYPKYNRIKKLKP